MPGTAQCSRRSFISSVPSSCRIFHAARSISMVIFKAFSSFPPTRYTLKQSRSIYHAKAAVRLFHFDYDTDYTIVMVEKNNKIINVERIIL
jgi:hypothetical protein